MAKDFLGNELFVGDVVVYPKSYYRELEKGIIEALNPAKATIKRLAKGGNGTTVRFYDQLCKIKEG